LTHAGAVMFVFGIGAVVPVLMFAYGSRQTLAVRSRGLGVLASIGKPAMGGALVVIGALTITGADKIAEAWLVDHMPEWLLALRTRTAAALAGARRRGEFGTDSHPWPGALRAGAGPRPPTSRQRACPARRRCAHRARARRETDRARP